LRAWPSSSRRARGCQVTLSRPHRHHTGTAFCGTYAKYSNGGMPFRPCCDLDAFPRGKAPWKGLAAGRLLRHDKPSPAQLGTAFWYRPQVISGDASAPKVPQLSPSAWEAPLRVGC
jgi:hypothetical protein